MENLIEPNISSFLIFSSKVPRPNRGLGYRSSIQNYLISSFGCKPTVRWSVYPSLPRFTIAAFLNTVTHLYFSEKLKSAKLRIVLNVKFSTFWKSIHCNVHSVTVSLLQQIWAGSTYSRLYIQICNLICEFVWCLGCLVDHIL